VHTGSNPVLTTDLASPIIDVIFRYKEKKDMSYRVEDSIEAPVVTIDDFYNDEKVLIIHSHINTKGKMILNKQEASLLLIELYKFINS
jgi:hypothetical protein